MLQPPGGSKGCLGLPTVPQETLSMTGRSSRHFEGHECSMGNVIRREAWLNERITDRV